MEDDKQQWKQTSRFAGDTEIAQIVCKQDDLDQWDKEADRNGRSRSRYLYSLIQEARAYREHGLTNSTGDEKRVQELEDEVEQLRNRLDEKESGSSEAVNLEPQTLKQDVLTENYQSLEEVLRTIVEAGLLDDLLREPVEKQLYFLAAQDQIEYERGWGWKLPENNGGGR